MPPKRKAQSSSVPEGGSSKPRKRASNTSKPQAKGKAVAPNPDTDWPIFFRELFRIFKALNSVLAFCSSRRNLAITFSVIRKSVEGILKQTLELERVSQIKALLPNHINFAYLSTYELRVNAASTSDDKGRRRDSPDPYASIGVAASTDSDEHVLVLEFVEPNNASKSSIGSGYSMAASLTPTAVKKLIEARNEWFTTAVNELLAACLATSEDPVALLSNAAKEHIPIDPAAVLAQVCPDSSPELTIPGPKDRETIEEVINQLKLSEDDGHMYCNQIVYERVFDQREPRWGKLERSLSDSVTHALEAARNVTGFYVHQADAINAVWSGKNVIVSTSTASGKSIIYQVPILCALEKDKEVTAMFIYPTKALAQDQKAAIEQLLHNCPGLEHIKVATYDGDTPQDQRATVRKTASIIFTNFDMLHASILPNEEHWRRFLKNLHLIVVDELHYYTDLFGSHVAMIMRRLRRVCAANGNQEALFVTCSATITNPRRHMVNMFGVEDVEVITDDGAPAGQKHFLLWNPPLIDEQRLELGKASSISEVCWLFRSLMKQGVRTIVFCKIRRTCETVMKTIRAELVQEGRADILAKVKAYRGGYSQQERRTIEHEAFSGNLLGIIATNALELGVDIGTLDAVIVLGFPFGIASLRQQMGRAGRRARDALTILVADERPIDQHYLSYPEELFSQNVGELHIDLDNKVIIESHLQCAANEMPIHASHDEIYFGPSFKTICESNLKMDKDGWFHTNPKFLPYPSKYISIRGIQEDKYAVVDVTLFERSKGPANIIEELELSRAIYELYEGGVFMHQGRTFIINEISHDEKIARMVRADVSWTTRPRDFKDIDAIQTSRIRKIKDSTKLAFYGSVQVSVKVYGFFKIRNKTILETVDIQTPPYQRMTTGMWMDVPKWAIDLMKQKGIRAAEAIHAAQHAILNQTYLASDIGTECKVPEKEPTKSESKRKRPARLIFYDVAGDGSGICTKAFDHISNLLLEASRKLDECSCQVGCRSCIQGTRCTQGNVVCSKAGASLVLKSLLDIEIDPDTVPNFGTLDEFDVVVEAETVRKVSDVEIEFE